MNTYKHVLFHEIQTHFAVLKPESKNMYLKKIILIVQMLIIAFCVTGMEVSGSTALTQTPVDGWSISLIGEPKNVLTQAEYEESTNFQRSSEKYVSLVDDRGKVWDGMPLWQIADQADDLGTERNANEKSAFNNKPAKNGYRITVTGTDGRETTLASSDIAGNNDYILAGAVNGNPLSENDPAFPLILVGKDIPTDQFIGGVSKITLHLDE